LEERLDEPQEGTGISVTFISSSSPRGFTSWLKNDVEGARSLDVVVGFLSSEGLEFLIRLIANRRDLTYRIVIGHAKLETLRRLEAKISEGWIDGSKVRLHLGFVRVQDSTQISGNFMMHSKVIYIEKHDGNDVLYVGSYNLTRAALYNENYEAAVRILAKRESKIMREAREYINKTWNEAVEYDPKKAELYAWKFNENVRDFVDQRIAEKIYREIGIKRLPVLILAAVSSNEVSLSEGGIIDVDIRAFPADLKTWIGGKLHVYLVNSAEDLSPILGKVIQKARRLLICTITGKASTAKSKLKGSAAKPSERYQGAIRYDNDEKTFLLIPPYAVKGEELGVRGESQLQARIEKVVTNREEIQRYRHRYIQRQPKVEDLIEFERKKTDKPGLILVGDLRIKERPILPIVKESLGYLKRQDPNKCRALSHVWRGEYIYLKTEYQEEEEQYVKSLTDYLEG